MSLINKLRRFCNERAFGAVAKNGPFGSVPLSFLLYFGAALGAASGSLLATNAFVWGVVFTIAISTAMIAVLPGVLLHTIVGMLPHESESASA